MAELHRFIFVFPVYNEEQNIPSVLLDLKKLTEHVQGASKETKFLFVDDGSTDQTAKQLRAAGLSNLEVVSHPKNLGPGAAFQTAFNQILASPYGENDLVITLEGDATSDPAILKRIMMRLQEDDDVILLSPYLYGGSLQSVLFHRVLISHFANGLIKLFLNLRGLSTFSCFFRVYRVRALRRMAQKYPEGIVTRKGFDCAVEILVKAVRTQLTISEIPFKVDWAKRKGKSKMKIWKTTLNYISLMFQYNVFWGKN